jgi:hypothetical protein
MRDITSSHDSLVIAWDLRGVAKLPPECSPSRLFAPFRNDLNDLIPKRDDFVTGKDKKPQVGKLYPRSPPLGFEEACRII